MAKALLNNAHIFNWSRLIYHVSKWQMKNVSHPLALKTSGRRPAPCIFCQCELYSFCYGRIVIWLSVTQNFGWADKYYAAALWRAFPQFIWGHRRIGGKKGEPVAESTISKCHNAGSSGIFTPYINYTWVTNMRQI